MSEPTPALPRFFFSYRRQDASAETGRLREALADALRERYPHASSQEVEAAIFLDVVGITAGRDFEATIEHKLSEVTVVIAVIGPRWRGSAGFWRSRIRRNADWVRRELEVARALPVAILPVRVDGALPLRERDLPASLRYLLRLQTPELRNERWDDDVDAFMRDVIRASELVLQNPDAFRGRAQAQPSAAASWWPLARNIALGGALLVLVAGVTKALISTRSATDQAAASDPKPASSPAKLPQQKPLGEFKQRPQSSGALAAVAPTHDSIGVFWVAPDHGVKNRYWDLSMGPDWNDRRPTWVTTPGAAAADSPVTVVARTQDDLHVFWIAPDHTIRSNHWHRDVNWRRDDWDLGSVADGSSVAALAREHNQLDIFWVGRDGDVRTSWWLDETKQWSSARPITYPDSAAKGSSVAAVARKRDLLEVFWVDPNGVIREKPWTAQRDWIKDESIVVTPPKAAMGRSALTVISRSPDQLDVFWITAQGAVNTVAWNETDEKNWLEHAIISITQDGAASPGAQVAALARADESLDLFWISTKGAIQTQRWAPVENGGWDRNKTAQVSPPGSAVEGSSISAVARTDSRLDLFWIDNDRGLRTLALQAAPGKPWVADGPTKLIQPEAIAESRATATP